MGWSNNRVNFLSDRVFDFFYKGHFWTEVFFPYYTYLLRYDQKIDILVHKMFLKGAWGAPLPEIFLGHIYHHTEEHCIITVRSIHSVTITTIISWTEGIIIIIIIVIIIIIILY